MTARTHITTRARTGDRGPPSEDRVMIHTVEQLGPKRQLLPNGNLLCLEVPVGRTGWMMYGPNETPVKPGPNGAVVYIERTADALFDPKTIGSCMAAAVVNDHPEDDVTPENWRQLAGGFATTNVRRGTGDDADVLLADLLITDKVLIKEVLAGKREVSLGYDADYTQTAPGVGYQDNLLINHIALVEKGRCGPRCAIGDREFQPQPQKEKPMATQRVKITPRKPRVDLGALRQKVQDAEAELDAAENDTGDDTAAEDGTHIHVHLPGTGTEAQAPATKTMDAEIDARFKVIEEGQQSTLAALGEITAALKGIKTGDAKTDPDEDEDCSPEEKAKRLKAKKDAEDKDGKTKDSAALEGSYTQVLAQAEILVPGFKMPTFDAAMLRKDTVDAMCKARRKCLDAAYATKDGEGLINGIAGTANVDLEKMDCAGVAILFNAAAGVKAKLNNRTTDGLSVAVQADKAVVPGLAEINKANAEYWSTRMPKG